MKGKPKVLEVLAGALTEELGAVVQYILHAEMCDNWGYKSLGSFTQKRAIEEMKHAEKLIERILFLEGAPTCILCRISKRARTSRTNSRLI